MFEDGSAATRLAWVLDQPPSAATHAVLESLVSAPLPRELQVLAAKAWDRQSAATSAMAAAARVAATVCTGGPDAQDDADAELALALRRTDNEMAYQLHQDRQLVTLPVLYGVLRDGECTLRHVTAFLDLTADLRPDDMLAVDETMSARTGSMTVSGFRRIVRKTVAKLDTRTAAERTKARRPRIGVRCHPQPDGLITIAATMPAADGVAYATALNRQADATRTPDDQRTHGERQVDVLLAAIGGSPQATAAAEAAARDDPAATTSTAVAVRPSRRVELQVVIDWRSLLGLRDDPAELIGYGSITAADVRAMLTHPGTTLRRLVTDPVTGVLVDYGTSRYRPDTYLSGLTKARDVTCRYPGCTRNAIYCDDEHCQAFPAGATSAANVCQLCRAHHRRKTTGRFTYTRPDPGNTEWLDHPDADTRWIPELPADSTADIPPPTPPPRPDDDPPPY